MQPVPCVMRTTLRLMAIEPSSVRATPAPRSPWTSSRQELDGCAWRSAWCRTSSSGRPWAGLRRRPACSCAICRHPAGRRAL